MIDLKQTKAICEAATAGPWDWHDVTELPCPGNASDTYTENMGCFRSPKGIICHFGDDAQYYPAEGEAPDEQDKAFIAHARTALPELVEWAERALQVLRDIAQGMEDHGQHVVATALRGIAAELEQAEPSGTFPADDPDTVPREWWDQLKRFIRESKSSVSPCLLLEEMHALENGR